MHTPPWKPVSCVAALLWPIVGVAQEYNPVVREPRAVSVSAPASANVIVKLRTEGRGGTLSKQSRDVQTAGVAARTGLKLALRREISESMIASTVDLTQTTEAAALERLRADPAVEFASPDRIRYAHATPSDPGFAGQWYLRAAEVSAVNATVAWDSELGRAGIVVAVLDTGVIYDHPDLGRGDRGRQAPAGIRLRELDAAQATTAMAATRIRPIPATGSTTPTRPNRPSPIARSPGAPGTARASPG